MKTMPGRWTWSAALLVAAACGGGNDAGAAAGGAPADSQVVPVAAPVAPESVASVPATDVPAGTPTPRTPPREPAPTAADSAAAAREDVSPEWKQRERSMGSYERCMEQTRGADAAVRARLETACARLPEAPK
ncbi:hypothetical protein [Longimicrobium sp.]|uniref:hypothetical protein n=1 Tax=Longimicrobium sp. TaxID=2029185 RepID=UPI002E342F60|nr:hypothetical protein [Longimicrobium sp.]HEX6039909.1 hypothetical protein [Longimicrobium sp.]